MAFLRTLYLHLACFLTLTTLPSLSTSPNVNLPSYPLAVKSPYLSTWVPGNQIGNAPTAQAEFWAGQPLTWSILARVNGEVYSLFGVPGGISNTTAATTGTVRYTSSHTLIELTAGKANITLDFFSPVLPGTGDYARQSLPYSYLTVTATSSSLEFVNVQLLSAIDHTWTAQNGASNLNYTTSGDAGLFWFYNPNQIPFTENSDMATYGSVVFATTTGSAVTHACDTAANIYAEFGSKGSLTASNTCTGTDLAALSKNLGFVNEVLAASVTFAVGFDREQTINYLGQTQVGYYRSKWPTVPDAVEYFLGDYLVALATSFVFDADVRLRSQAVSRTFGSNYADIIEASVRQTFGAIDITVLANDLTATPSAFLKEISSDGNVNTVDLIYQSWPIFISLNPWYIRGLFQPILSYLELPASDGWPEPFVVHDLGSHYLNATGHNNGVAESMPLFETSTLFILLYAYQKYTGDATWAKQFLPLLEGYAEYLSVNSLFPASQLTSVDAIGATANQTALAIQSPIGLKAASIITGNTTYATIAASFANKIFNEALGLDGATVGESTHFTYNYGKNSTWNVVFASYSDVLLELNTFPAAAWELQSAWYQSQIQEEGLPFAGPITDLSYVGVPLMWGITDWNVVAAGASSTAVQEAIINTTHTFLTNGLNTVPFGTKYNVEGPNVGVWIGNKARSTVGSHFALLALEQGTWGTAY